MQIEYSYNNADAVIFQSQFNKLLTEHWFGKHKNSYVFHNAPDITPGKINGIITLKNVLVGLAPKL